MSKLTKIKFKKKKDSRYSYDIYIDDKLEGELISYTGWTWTCICDRLFIDEEICGAGYKRAQSIAKMYILMEIATEEGKEIFGDDFLER